MMKFSQLRAVGYADFVTLGGLICVVISLFLSINQYFTLAYVFLCLQFVFDCLDGTIARKTKLSNLGFYLDSYSDFAAMIAVTVFGFFVGMDTTLMYIAAVVFVTASAIRLAYFSSNFTQDNHSFVGIPTTLAMIIAATLILGNYYFELVENSYLVIIYFILACAMVSDVVVAKPKLFSS